MVTDVSQSTEPLVLLERDRLFKLVISPFSLSSSNKKKVKLYTECAGVKESFTGANNAHDANILTSSETKNFTYLTITSPSTAICQKPDAIFEGVNTYITRIFYAAK